MVMERQNKRYRGEKPKPLFLQERDRDILVSVHDFGFLTRSQIQKLFDFNCVTRVNIRLRKLFDHGYLSRRFLPTVQGSSQAIYFLGPEGISLVSERLGIDPGELVRERKVISGRKEMFLAHDLSINDVRIAIQRVLAGKPNTSFDRWVSYTDCLQKWKSFNPGLGREQEMVFRPDGYFRYYRDGKLFGCFLELDRSTMSNPRFRRKVETYLHYAGSGLYPQKYDLRFFRVLVAAPTKERLINLKSTTEQVTDKMFWFTLTESLTDGKVFETVWQRPGKEGTFSLLD